MIDDPQSAIAEAEAALVANPDSKALRLALIKALCFSGKEIEAFEEWNALVKDYEDLKYDRNALEILSWGVLNKGESSNQLTIKVSALLGASMTRDAKAIPLILNALKGSNSLLRAIGVGLAAQYGDIPLQDEIARLLKEEKVFFVRLELFKAVGALRMKEAKPQLIRIISEASTLAEEKVAAIVSLVNMYDSVGDSELANLIRSNRAGLRELACQVIIHLDLKEKIDMIIPLLFDPHPSVRMSALNALALLKIEKLGGRPIMQTPSIDHLLQDHVPEVAITAAWLSLLNDDQRFEKYLQKWTKDVKHTRLVAGALAISGKKGVPYAKKLIKKTNDPYVQVTLAIGLISQREDIAYACKLIDRHVGTKQLLMWDNSQNPLFRTLAPSTVCHIEQIANYPKVVDQLTRLELLQILCILNYPKAQESVKGFLQKNTWGVVGTAAATLLQEGDDEALDVIRALLKDSDEKVRIQAALILAMLGGDKAAVQVLKEVYPKVSRELKIQILESLAKVGDPESTSFLLERLGEPFQVLRVVAATAIIQCLYH